MFASLSTFKSSEQVAELAWKILRLLWTTSRLGTEVQGRSSLGNPWLEMASFRPEWDFFKLGECLFELYWVSKLQVGFSKFLTVVKPGVSFLKLRGRVKLRRNSLKLRAALFKLHWVLRKGVGVLKTWM